MNPVAQSDPGAQTLEAEIRKREQSEARVATQIKVLETVALGAPLADTLTEILKACEAQVPEMLGSILLLDPDGVHLRHGAAPSLPPEYMRAIDGAAIGPVAGSCGTAAFLKRQILVGDIATDPLWEAYRGLALPHGLRACWSTPVFDNQGRVIATFAMYFRAPGLPLEEHLKLIETHSHLASIAIVKERTEAALRISESRYRKLVESNAIGVMISDFQGNTTEANDRFLNLIGYSRDDLSAGRVNWAAITPPGWESVDAKAIEELRAKGVTGPFEKEYLHKDGHRVPFQSTVVLLDSDKGEGLFLIEDRTEKKRAESKIQEQLEELMRWQEVVVGREDRIQELKREINRLLADLGKPARYTGPRPT